MFYLCRGFPDVLVEREAVIKAGDAVDGVNSDRNGTKFGEVEVAHLKKCGEVFGALHCLVTTKAIKHVFRQSSAAELSCVTANGLLVDQIWGSILCRLSLGKDAETLELSLGRLPRTYVSHKSLCNLMKLNEVNAGHVISFHTAHVQIIVSESFKWFVKGNFT